jgi:DNA relaxase NicK
MLYDLFFKSLFGDLQSMGHGGRGFEEIWMAPLLGFKMYDMPYRGDVEYFHFEIPGQACELIPWEIFQGFEDVLRSNYPDRYHYTRLDIAFDHAPFTPQDIEDAISNGKVRSLAKRETMQVHKSPFERKDNGEEGTHTVSFGSRLSERMIRVYDRRGFTRLEMELKDKRADLVAKEVFKASNISEWFPIAMSHLRDYVDFDAPWWGAFVNGIPRAKAVVTTPRELALDKKTEWLRNTVATTLSIVHDVRRDGFAQQLLTLGRKKRMETNKYDILYKNLDEQAREAKAKVEDGSE